MRSSTFLSSPATGRATMRERRLAARELSLRLRCRLTEDPVDQLAIGDSAHGVFFLSDAMRNISVAVKIHRAPEKGQRELEALQRARGYGLTALIPAFDEMIDAPGVDGAFLVTTTMPGLDPLTTTDWEGSGDWNGYVVENAYLGRIALTLESTSRHIARMHRHLTHGDLQLKNIGTALDAPDDGYVTYDLEGSTFKRDCRGDQDEHDYLTRCAEDLLTYVRSLISKGFLAHSSTEIFEGELLDRIIEPYLDAGGDPAVLDGNILESCVDAHRFRDGRLQGAAGHGRLRI